MRPGGLRRLASAVRDRRVSATALVTESLSRLERHSDLHVAALLDGEGALARAADLDRGDGPRGALAGLPTLIKDLEDWAGHPTRQGSLALADAPPAPHDAVTPARLHRAGALSVGKATLPEFALEGYTANLATGITRNPWNLELSPGGSSGGSAAALAAGLVAIATATDGGGSVRIPASFCGLLGLKPTTGAIGRYPAPDWIDYSTDGPLATSADDLELLYGVMVGPAPGDPGSPPAAALDLAGPPPRRLIAATRTSPLGPLPEEVERSLREGAAALADLLDLELTWREPESFFAGGDPDLDWFVVTSAEHVASLGRSWVERHLDLMHPSSQEFLRAGLDVGIEEYLAARRRRFAYVRALDEILADAWLVTPTVASTGFLADGRLRAEDPVGSLPPEVYSTAVQNVVGLPAISLPMGSLTTGLPFGLQVTAPRWRDRDLIGLAARVEEAFPWPRCAPGFTPLDEAFEL